MYIYYICYKKSYPMHMHFKTRLFKIVSLEISRTISLLLKCRLNFCKNTCEGIQPTF